MADKILEILDALQPILLIVVPAIWVGYLQVKKKLDEKTKVFKTGEVKKNKNIYDTYIHEQSKETIRRVQEMCNLYKDKTKADQVMYIQIENGTVATSKLCNMFVSCLAEDDRYSVIPKKTNRVQRRPFSTVVNWIPEDASVLVEYSEMTTRGEIANHEVFEKVGSSLSTGVFNREGILLGMVLLNYKDANYDGAEAGSQKILLNGFKSAVESIFISYDSNCASKKKELNLEEE